MYTYLAKVNIPVDKLKYIGGVCMYVEKLIDLSFLRLNTSNPRFRKVETELEAVQAILNDNYSKLINLIRDLVEHGLNPSELPIVLEDRAKPESYIVYEGNRRIAALRLLKDPELLDKVQLSSKTKSIIRELATRTTSELFRVRCVVFQKEKDAIHWIYLKHTGENNGIGTVNWTSQQRKNFLQKMGKELPSLQVLHFYQAFYGSDMLPTVFPSSILEKLIYDPDVRRVLGFTMSKGSLYSQVPKEELQKGIKKLVEDIATRKVKFHHVRTKDDRMRYMQEFTEDDLPVKNELVIPIIFEELVPNKSDQMGQQNLFDEAILGKERSTEMETKTGSFSEEVVDVESSMGIDVENKIMVTQNESALEDVRTSLTSSRKTHPSSISLPPRKYLLPTQIQLKVPDAHTSLLLRQLEGILLQSYPFAIEILFRVFIERMAHQYMSDNQMPERDNLANNLLLVSKDFLHRGSISIDQFSKIEEKIPPSYYVGAHQISSHLSAQELQTWWDVLEPVITQVYS